MTTPTSDPRAAPERIHRLAREIESGSDEAARELAELLLVSAALEPVREAVERMSAQGQARFDAALRDPTLQKTMRDALVADARRCPDPELRAEILNWLAENPPIVVA